MTTETRLIEWQKIKAEIAQCHDINIMSKMNYSIEAVQKWAKQSKQSLETQNEIAEYRLRLNRKQGEWIEANIPVDGSFPNVAKNSRVTLADVGIGENDSPKFRVLAKVPEERFERYIAEIKSSSEELTTTGLCNLVKHKPHVAQNSGNSEWYTPSCYVEAAREVMGNIDCDPASTEVANRIIKAGKCFTSEDNGLTNKWAGNVWMNPPYTQPLVTEFCDLLVEKYESGEVKQACVLVNNATETEFYQNMLKVCSAVCFIKGRVKFIDKLGEESGTPLQGQTILYFGAERDKFKERFQKFGETLDRTG